MILILCYSKRRRRWRWCWWQLSQRYRYCWFIQSLRTYPLKGWMDRLCQDLPPKNQEGPRSCWQDWENPSLPKGSNCLRQAHYWEVRWSPNLRRKGFRCWSWISLLLLQRANRCWPNILLLQRRHEGREILNITKQHDSPVWLKALRRVYLSLF